MVQRAELGTPGAHQRKVAAVTGVENKILTETVQRGPGHAPPGSFYIRIS